MPTWSAERRWSSLWGTSSSCEEGRRRWCRPTPWCRATTSSSARKCCRSSPAMSLVYYLWSAAGGGVVSKHWEHCLPSGELGTTAFSLGVSSLRSRGRPGIWAAAYALARVEMRTNNSIKMQSSPLLPINNISGLRWECLRSFWRQKKYHQGRKRAVKVVNNVKWWEPGVLDQLSGFRERMCSLWRNFYSHVLLHADLTAWKDTHL